MKNKFCKMFIVGLIMYFFMGLPVQARVLPRFTNTGSSSNKYVSSSVTVSPRLRKDKTALVVYFSNLKKSKSIFYTLVYNTNESQEGVSGSIDSSQDSITRELLFGVCSTNNVCHYHSNISNMKFEVIVELSSGKKTMKRYKVRI